MIKKAIFVISLLLVFSSVQSQELPVESQRLSVKGRWNIKASYARYKEFNENYNVLFHIEGSKLFSERRFAKQSNPRIELNYGVLNWLEAGVYLGFMMYRYLPYSEEFWLNPKEDFKYAYAPYFWC